MSRNQSLPGLLLVNMGRGKGKTTAALGTAIRALGQGLKVAVIQFLKSARTGEAEFLTHLAECSRYPLSYQKLGAGFIRGKITEKDIAAAREAFEAAKKAASEVDLLVLDEFGWALKWELLDLEEALHFLDNRPEALNVIITGREMPQAIIDRAHTVTDMVLVKHAYQAGIKARPGLEF